jgi:hypothetical protein
VVLYGLADSTTTSEVVDFFESSITKAPRICKLLLGNLYQMEGKVDLAEKENNEIIAENPDTSLAVRAAINNLRIELYSRNNVQKAQEILSQVERKASLVNSMELAEAEHTFANYVDPKTGQMPNFKMAKNNSGEVTADTSISSQSVLMSNYPNPFNPSTQISYQLEKAGLVSLKVYDILGRNVATLVNRYQDAGKYNVTFNAANLASGIYIYQLRTNNLISTKKMILMK